MSLIVNSLTSNDADIWRLWCERRFDTCQIARELKLREAFVARRLAYLRDSDRAKRLEAQSA